MKTPPRLLQSSERLLSVNSAALQPQGAALPANIPPSKAAFLLAIALLIAAPSEARTEEVHGGAMPHVLGNTGTNEAADFETIRSRAIYLNELSSCCQSPSPVTEAIRPTSREGGDLITDLQRDLINCGPPPPGSTLAHRVRFQAQIQAQLIAVTKVESASFIPAATCHERINALQSSIPAAQQSAFLSALTKARAWVDACVAKGGCTSVDRHSWFSAGSTTHHVDTEVFAGIACK